MIARTPEDHRTDCVLGSDCFSSAGSALETRSYFIGRMIILLYLQLRGAWAKTKKIRSLGRKILRLSIEIPWWERLEVSMRLIESIV